MNSSRNQTGGGSPGNSTESDNESEAADTLGPLPDDLLIHPHEADDENIHRHPLPHHHRSPIPPTTSPPPPSHTPNGVQDKKPPPASRRRSVEAGSGRPIFPVRNPTKQDLVHARKLIASLQKEHGFVLPDRGNLDDPSILWKEGKPDYTVADLQFLLGKTKNHPPGSLELFVENFVKTWEMEATHKEFYQWTTVDQSAYEVQSNGGRVFDSYEAPWVGNYNWLLSSCSKDVYDYQNETFESSHGKFRYAFPEGFPWEILEVFSPPPKVAFSWRHWAVFSGEFEGHKGSGETINMTGFGVVTLNESNKMTKLEIYFDPDSFINVLRGKKECTDGVDSGMAVGKPIAGGLESLSCMMAAIELEEQEGEGVTSAQKREDMGDDRKQSGRCPFSGAT